MYCSLCALFYSPPTFHGNVAMVTAKCVFSESATPNLHKWTIAFFRITCNFQVVGHFCVQTNFPTPGKIYHILGQDMQAHQCDHARNVCSHESPPTVRRVRDEKKINCKQKKCHKSTSPLVVSLGRFSKIPDVIKHTKGNSTGPMIPDSRGVVFAGSMHWLFVPEFDNIEELSTGMLEKL